MSKDAEVIILQDSNKSHIYQNEEGTIGARLRIQARNCSRVTNAIIQRNVTGPYYSQSHFN